MDRHDIIVIGGSMGSRAPLRQLLAGLPPDLPASVLVTTHMPTNGSPYLAETLRDASALPVAAAVDGQPVESGRVYVAVPDRHLLIVDHAIVLGTGPRENMVRPAIDAMFRSAALALGARVIGVVLSGMLNDGAAGLSAIHGRGGLTVVQHPLDAEAGDMPRAALEAVDVDHVAPGAELAGVVASLVQAAPGPTPPASTDLELEVQIALGRRIGTERMHEIATPSAVICPNCGGVLSEMKAKGPLRYRCQIGHAFTAETLLDAQEHNVEDALRIAMRMMEERVELVTRMARDARETGPTAIAELYEARAREYQGYAATLRRAATQSLRSSRSPGADPF